MIRKIDSNIFSLTILKVTTFSRIRQPLQNIRKAINMLRGVVSTTVVKEPVLTKTQKQQAFVKESLTRALQEVKLAKLEGRKLPDARDLLKDLEMED
ncbi:hypothetical protein V7T12_15405 [Segatella copri]|uniref:hypothetical protein n=1 Tax=Segatella copri TaxID=165179 RepID=UPI002FEF462B